MEQIGRPASRSTVASHKTALPGTPLRPLFRDRSLRSRFLRALPAWSAALAVVAVLALT